MPGWSVVASLGWNLLLGLIGIVGLAQALAKYSFWRGDCALGYHSMKFRPILSCSATRTYHVYKK